MTHTQRDESNQLPEEAPAGQAPEGDGGSEDSPARSSEVEREGQGESRGAQTGDESAQTGHPTNAG